MLVLVNISGLLRYIAVGTSPSRFTSLAIGLALGAGTMNAEALNFLWCFLVLRLYLLNFLLELGLFGHNIGRFLMLSLMLNH